MHWKNSSFHSTYMPLLRNMFSYTCRLHESLLLFGLMYLSLISIIYYNYTTLTLSNPGCFRQYNDPGGGGERALKAPSAISKTIVLIFTISYMCISLGVLGMFQLEFFKNSRFWPFYSDVKIKSSEISCTNDINYLLFCLKWTSNTPKKAEF